MRSEERWERIVQLVDQQGFITIQALSQTCKASMVTIRRDLESLDRGNRLRRTHGGAVSLHAGQAFDPERQNPSAPLANDPDADQPLVDRLDALIAAELLPRFTGLIQKSGGKTRIPVIAESLPLADTATFVAVDNYQAGYDLGCWAGDYAQANWRGEAHVLDLAYHRPNTQARSRGFLDGLRHQTSEVEVVFSVNTQSRYEMAYQLTRDALTVHPNINLIFAMNDISARGAYDACKELGIASDQLIILTFGIEGPNMIELVMKNEFIKGGVCMFPEIVATTCIEAAIAAWNQQTLPSQLVTPYSVVTSDTLKNFYQKTENHWHLQWQNIIGALRLPLPVNGDEPDTQRPLPHRLGFIYTFVEHDWYKTLSQTMREYTGKLGIQLELLDIEQTQRDELNQRRIEIARRAASEVKSGDTIFIDAGVISKEMAEQLRDRNNITIITNSMPVIEGLKDAPGEMTLICIGGVFRRASQSFVGPTAEAMLKEFRIDKLFLMAAGVSKNFGISHTNISEVTIKQQMLHSAREVILLADYTCFQQEALIQVAPITMVHKVITDDALPPSIRLELGTLGISVILAAM